MGTAMVIKQRKERNRSRDKESDIRQTTGARQGLYLDTATGKVEEKKKRNGRKTKKIGQKEQEYKNHRYYTRSNDTQYKRRTTQTK